MRPLRANTLKDHGNFFFHYGLAAAVTAGAFVAIGSPLALGGIAAATAVALRLRERSEQGAFVTSVKEEREQNLKREQSKDFDTPKAKAGYYYDKMRQGLVEGWTSRYAKLLGMESVPDVLIVRPPDPVSSLHTEKGLGTAFRAQFNKYANAFAVSHDKDNNVVLSAPIVSKLDERELQGVVAHEVGHIAAHHHGRQGAMRMMGHAARVLGFLNKGLTVISNVKNIWLYYGARVISDAGVTLFARASHLDLHDPATVSALGSIKKYANSAAIAGLAVVFQAPDMLLAEGIRFATTEGIDLIQKRYARRNEFQADRLAAEVTKDPIGLSTGLEKIHASQNVFWPKPLEEPQKESDAMSSFLGAVKDIKASHPNVERRVARLQSMSGSMEAWHPS